MFHDLLTIFNTGRKKRGVYQTPPFTLGKVSFPGLFVSEIKGIERFYLSLFCNAHNTLKTYLRHL